MQHQQSGEPEEAKSENSSSAREHRTAEITVPTEVPTRTSTGHGTGPRTLEGKERSKRNATKHGIFSSVVVLKGEANAQYESLLDGLWKALEPEGGLEELLVEKLATISWRHRRLLVAEGAEIRRSTEFVEWDQRDREQEEAKKMGTPPSLGIGKFSEDEIGGLIEKIDNPHALENCLELLLTFRKQMQTDRVSNEQGSSFLKKIYGWRERLCPTFYDICKSWLHAMNAPEEERKRQESPTPEWCRQKIMSEIDEEVRRLKEYQETRAAIQFDKTRLEILRRSVPDSPELDRLLRYEVSLERSFDRTLNQLERLQRMRLGQPVTPRIDVSVS